MAFDDVLDRCLQQWRGEGISLMPPIAEEEIKRIWAGFGQKPSRDVLRLYATTGGFKGYEYAGNFLWRLWSLEPILEENAIFPGRGILFCDHCIRVRSWELCFEDDDHSSVWVRNNDDSVLTSSSLESFFVSYLEDPRLLL